MLWEDEVTSSRSIYAIVTARIVEELKRGAVPWVKPWRSEQAGADLGGLPANAITGRSYTGVNILTLWDAAARRGYPSHRWLTFRQAREAGGSVRKGEEGTAIVFTKQIAVEDVTAGGEVSPRRIPVLRGYTVFNVAQVEGLPDRLHAVPEGRPTGERHAAAARLIEATGAAIHHGGGTAGYSPARDAIAVPPAAAFFSAGHDYATVLHELGHWSGHESRLARDLAHRFGSRAYAAEELVAELTAAFLCAELGIEGRLRHAGYIQSWLELLEHDHRAIFSAASKASRAAAYLRSFSEPEASEAGGGGDG